MVVAQPVARGSQDAGLANSRDRSPPIRFSRTRVPCRSRFSVLRHRCKPGSHAHGGVLFFPAGLHNLGRRGTVVAAKHTPAHRAVSLCSARTLSSRLPVPAPNRAYSRETYGPAFLGRAAPRTMGRDEGRPACDEPSSSAQLSSGHTRFLPLAGAGCAPRRSYRHIL